MNSGANGKIFIEKDPPSEASNTQTFRQRIIDYLAYLKEQLNFIFSNYGRRLVDAADNVNELTRTATETTSRISDAEGDISTLQQTAQGLASTVSDLSGNVTTLQETATGLTSQVSGLNGRVSTVEQTADGLTTRVGTAEGNISSLQQTANGLASRVSTAEGDISTLEQTANGLSASVESTAEKLSSIGGRNYAWSISSNYHPDLFRAQNCTYTYNPENNGEYVLTSQGGAAFPQIWHRGSSTTGYPVPDELKGTKVTWHCDYISASGADPSPRAYIGFRKNNADQYILYLNPERLSYTFTVPSDCEQMYVLLRVRQDGTNINGETMTVRGLKLERGEVATDWTPAPEDDSSAIAANKTAIEVNAEGISSKVSNTDYNGQTIASLINQTATDASINAQKINLTGYVTASSLTASGTTTIDGSRINTGHIDAARIAVEDLNALGATIAGWTIGTTELSKSWSGSLLTHKAGISAPATPDNTSAAFYVSATVGSATTYPFRVNYDGKLIATSAEIEGTITSSNATITGGSVTIDSSDSSATLIKLNASTQSVALNSYGLNIITSDNKSLFTLNPVESSSGAVSTNMVLYRLDNTTRNNEELLNVSPSGIRAREFGTSRIVSLYGSSGLSITDGTKTFTYDVPNGIFMYNGTNQYSALIWPDSNGAGRLVLGDGTSTKWRTELTNSGLVFRNASDAVTAQYSAAGPSHTIKTADNDTLSLGSVKQIVVIKYNELIVVYLNLQIGTASTFNTGTFYVIGNIGYSLARSIGVMVINQTGTSSCLVSVETNGNVTLYRYSGSAAWSNNQWIRCQLVSYTTA